MLCSRLLRPPGETAGGWQGRFAATVDHVFEALRRRYAGLLRASLDSLPVISTFAAIVLASIYFLYAGIRSELAPAEDQGVLLAMSAGMLLSIALMPLLVVCVLTSAVPALLQSGFAMASEALKLNFGALNPINGLKKLFSLRTLKDTVKALFYLGSFALALWIVWITQRKLLFAQLFARARDLFAIWGHLLLVLVLVLVWVVQALDWYIW